MIIKKTRLILWITVIFTLLSGSLYGIFERNMPVTLTQPDGSIFEARYTGEHPIHRFHDENNYTIIQEIGTGIWYWAEEDGKGGLKPNGYQVHLHSPEGLGLKPGIDISARRRSTIYKLGMLGFTFTDIDLIQPDGEVFKATLVSTGYYEYINGNDLGFPIILDDASGYYCWAITGEDGYPYSSGYPVHLYPNPSLLGISSGNGYSIDVLEDILEDMKLNMNEIEDNIISIY